MVGDFKLLQYVYMLCVFNFTVLLQVFFVFFVSIPEWTSFVSGINCPKISVAAGLKQMVDFSVLKVNIKGKKMGAGRLLSGHPSFTVLCQTELFILLFGGSRINLCYETSLQKLFASCAHHWGQWMIHGPKDVCEIFLVCNLFFNIYHFSVNFRSHNYYHLVSVHVG